jgi:hypothetical protein
VRRLHGQRQGQDQGGSLAGRLGRAAEFALQAAARAELQGKEGPVLMLADREDLHDVRVL